MAGESKALALAVRTPARTGERSPARLGRRTLMEFAGARGVRQAVLTGAAFALGYQLSRMMRTGRLPALFETAQDAYRAASSSDPVAEGRLAGQRVRRSMTVVSTVYGYVDRNED